MKRKIIEKLIDWKSSKYRMPLILKGARQVGKSYILNEFADKNYDNKVYFNLETNRSVAEIFDGDITASRIIPMLEMASDERITPHNTLIILDEIQSCPRALLSLKVFCEEAPQYHVAAAGSLLGVALNRKGISYPVGKVYEMTMYPLDFEEFLWAFKKEDLAEMIRSSFENDKPLDNFYHEMALDLYKKYLVIGGMPNVINRFLDTNSFIEAQTSQELIYNQYVSDMAKYPDDYKTVRIRACYDSVTQQLAKENKKFQYKIVKKGATATYFEESIDWLKFAGIGLKCVKLNSGKEPAEAYADNDSFKMYLSDVGLLVFKSGINMMKVLNDISVDNNFLGGVVENYVAQQFTANNHSLFYWTSDGKAEVDFVLSIDGKVIPVEVKKNVHTASKSLSVFTSLYAKDFAIRISAKNFGLMNGIKSVPLYAVFCI